MKFVFLSLLPIFLFSLPKGLEVQHGIVTVNTDENTLNIESSFSAILHWSDFSISEKELVHFSQTNSQSIVLNRVISSQTSELLGHLTSNGSVFLINPNGVMIGPNAHIQTAGFLASTADIYDHEFLENDSFSFSSLNDAQIVNEGKISCPNGDIYLIGKNLDNQGTLSAQNVNVVSAEKVLIKPADTKRIFITSDLKPDTIESFIETSNVYEKAIRNTGKIEALSTREENGKIYLYAEKGKTEIEGLLTSESGDIQVLANEIFVREGSIVEASGKVGGSIFIGGGERGKELGAPNAEIVLIEEGAAIKANGTDGNAGKVIFWGEKEIDYRGETYAQALGATGDGGFVEVSSHGVYSYQGFVDGSSKNGKNGQLLLDPVDITVSGGVTSPAYPTTPPGTYAPLVNAILNPTSFTPTLDAGTDVFIDSTGGAGGSGDITFTAAVSWTGSGNLTATAHRGIAVNANITSSSATGGSVTLIGQGTPVSNIAGVFIPAGTTVQTNAGQITIQGNVNGSVVTNIRGIDLEGNLQTTSGDVSLTGTSTGTAASNEAINMIGQITSTSGSVSLDGDITSLAVGVQAIDLRTGMISTDSGMVDIEGTAISGFGILVQSSFLIQTMTGDVEIDGQGTGGIAYFSNIQSTSGAITLNGVGDTFDGLEVNPFPTSLISTAGNVSLTGSTNSGTQGILVDGGTIQTTGTGSITFDGTNTMGNTGTAFTNSATVESVNGPINVINTPIGSEGGAISVDGGATVESTGTGSITFRGTASSGASGCQGISIAETGTIVESSQGNITMTAEGKGSSGCPAFEICQGANLLSDSGSISVIGNAAGTDDNSPGILIDGANTLIQAQSKSLTLTGTAAGSLNLNQGILVSNGAKVENTSGSITLNGTGSTSGTSSNEGILLTDAMTEVTSATGAINLTGTKGGGTLEGIKIDNQAEVVATNSATITVTTLSDLLIDNAGSIDPGVNGNVNFNITTDLIVLGSDAVMAPSFINLINGAATFVVGRDLIVQGGTVASSNAQIGYIGNSTGASGSMTFQVGRDVTIQGGTTGFALIGHGGPSVSQVLSGNLDFTSVGRNMNILGADALAQLGAIDDTGGGSTLSGNISCTTQNNINVTAAGAENARIGFGGQSMMTTFNPSTITLKAGVNINMLSSGMGETQIVNANGPITLVTDNLFPTPILHGPGGFSLNSLLSASGELRIYTVTPNQNTINDLINGAAFTPGPFNVDSSTEQWSIYFPDGSYEGAPFKFYYKLPISGFFQGEINERIAANLVALNNLLPVISPRGKIPPSIPAYHFEACYYSYRCTPDLHPYGCFIFEDTVIWIPIRP